MNKRGVCRKTIVNTSWILGLIMMLLLKNLSKSNFSTKSNCINSRYKHLSSKTILRKTYCSSAVYLTSAKECVTIINNRFQGDMLPRNYESFVRGVTPTEMDNLVNLMSSCGRELLSIAQRPMLVKVENLLTFTSTQSADNLVALTPCLYNDARLLKQLLATRSITFGIPCFIAGDDSFYVALVITKYVLRHLWCPNKVHLLYPILFFNQNLLLNGIECLDSLTTARTLQSAAVPTAAITQEINWTSHLLMNKSFAREAGIPAQQFKTITSGIESSFGSLAPPV